MSLFPLLRGDSILDCVCKSSTMYFALVMVLVLEIFLVVVVFVSCRHSISGILVVR